MNSGSSERPWTDDEIEQFFEEAEGATRWASRVAMSLYIARIFVAFVFFTGAVWVLLAALSYFGVL